MVKLGPDGVLGDERGGDGDHLAAPISRRRRPPAGPLV